MSIRLLAVPIFCLSVVAFAAAAVPPAVAVIEDSPWSPGDAPRDGAAEMGVLLRLAELQQNRAAVGLIGVGDRRGVFQEGTRRALEFAIQQGVPVVRLARESMVKSMDREDGWFIDGGSLSPAAAAGVLGECLNRYGTLPKVASLHEPSSRELEAYRAKLRLFQAEFSARQPAMVAMR